MKFIFCSNYSPAQISAFVGYGSPSQAEMTVESFIIHPDYDLPLNDIALIKVRLIERFLFINFFAVVIILLVA